MMRPAILAGAAILALLAGCATAQTPPNTSNTTYTVGVDSVTGLKCLFGTTATCSLSNHPVTVVPTAVTIATAMTWQPLLPAGARNGCIYTNNTADTVYILELAVSGVATTPQINAASWLFQGDIYTCVPGSNNALSITSASVSNAVGSFKAF